MADDKVIVQIALDNGEVLRGLAQFEKKAQEVGKNVEKNFSGKIFENLEDSAKSSLGGISSAFSKMPAAILPLGAAVFALKKVFDFSKEGEQILALEKRFDFLAEREGLSAKKIKEGLELAGGGLVSLNDLFQSSSRAIAVFGENASRLPEILDVARKSATTLGLDTVQNFEAISQAIQSGSQRALKNAGIILDVEKVYQSFAKSIGTTKAELTETQRQAALLDAVIKKGGETFKGVTNDLTPLSNSTKALGVAFQDLGEKIKASLSEQTSRDLALGIQTLTVAIQGLAGTKTAQSEIDLLGSKIASLKAEIISFQSAAKGNQDIYAGEIKLRQQALVGLESELKLRKDISSARTDDDRKAAARLGVVDQKVIDAAKGTQSKLTAEQLVGIKNRQAQLAGAIAANDQAVIQSREKLLAFETNADVRRQIQGELTSQKLLLLAQEEKAKIAEINRQFNDVAGFEEFERQALRESVLRDFALRRVAIESSANEELQRSAKQNAERIAIITQGLSNIVAQGATKMAEALLKGGNAFQEFGNAIVGIIADEVIKLGQALLIQGLAIETFVTSINSLLPGSGAAAAAAGLGLILFGTALKSAVGGGASSGATPSVTPGGGGFSAPVGETTATAFEPQEQQSKIEVNIQGDVFDTQETGLRIVDIIQSSFDKQGTTLVTGTA